MDIAKEEKNMIARLTDAYRVGNTSTMLEMEESVCGCRYGATSWTTQTEAKLISELLSLTQTKSLLEVGSGSGWPGLYIAKLSKCHLTLIDIPFSGLSIARNRIFQDQLQNTCNVLAANAYNLPFSPSSFDTIFHADLLCCLFNKTHALKSMRKVIKNNGCMVFSVISLSPGLSKKDYQQAVSSAPVFVETEKPYSEILNESKWKVLHQQDISKEYLESVKALRNLEKKNKEELDTLLGFKKNKDLAAYRKATENALEAGLIRRNLYKVNPGI